MTCDSEDGTLTRPRTLRWGGRLTRKHRWISRSCRSLKFTLSGPPPLPVNHPFCGTLTSQLKCTECGYKSPVRYDKFESLSLTLPIGMGDLGWGRHKLHQLLSNFVTAEVVNDVSCEGCNRGRDKSLTPILAKQLKIQQFGKVGCFDCFFFLCVVIFFFLFSCRFVCAYTFRGTRGIRAGKCPSGRTTYSFRYVCR